MTPAINAALIEALPVIVPAWRTLAAAVTDTPADSMFEAIIKKHSKRGPGFVEQAVRELLAMHSLPWPPPPLPAAPPQAKPIKAQTEAVSEPIAVEAPTKQPEAERQQTRRTNQPGLVAEKETYALAKDFYRMPNVVADYLLAGMSGPVLKAYVYVHRLAKTDGTFWVSAGGLANKIGCTSRRHGQRVLDRLLAAGLVRLLERGGPVGFKANTYQLVPPGRLDLEKAREVLSLPLSPHPK